jgi:hypothetical protein
MLAVTYLLFGMLSRSHNVNKQGAYIAIDIALFFFTAWMMSQ